MKTIFTITVIIILFSNNIVAGMTEKGFEYYISHLSDSDSNLHKLSNQSFSILKTGTNQNEQSVTELYIPTFTEEIKSNTTQSVKVDKIENETIIVEHKKNSNSQLLNLFFNFI